MNLQDIAKLAQVSKSAVSLALNDKPGISEETRQRVLAIAEAHQYTLPKIASRKVKDIFFVILKDENQAQPYTTLPFFSELIELFETKSRFSGYQLLIKYVDGSEQAFHDLVHRSDYAGLLLLGTNIQDQQLPIINRLKGPLVVLDNNDARIQHSAITIDNAQGVMQALDYLVRAGHRRIGYLDAQQSFANFRERRQAFQDFAAAHPQLDCFIEEGLANGMSTDAALLAQSELLAHLPDVFLCANDYIALQLIKFLTANDLRVPQDVSVMGFDGIREGSLIYPELSTVAVSKKELAEWTIKVLLSNSPTPIKIQVHNHLLLRDSVKD